MPRAGGAPARSSRQRPSLSCSLPAWFAAANLGASEQPVEPAEQTVEMSTEQVASAFLDAYASYDADTALSYIAEDSTSSSRTEFPLSRTEFPLQVAWNEAAGFRYIDRECPSASSAVVRCTFAFHALGSDAAGLGPFTGGEWMITVRDGKVVSVEDEHAAESNGFLDIVTDAFTSWLTTNYPDDAAVMFLTGGDFAPRLTEQSIALWEQHVQEYVALSGGQ